MRQNLFRITCDRCGAIVEVGKRPERIEHCLPRQDPNYEIHFAPPKPVPEVPKDWTVVRHQGQEKDLCPECTVIMDAFWKNKAEEAA